MRDAPTTAVAITAVLAIITLFPVLAAAKEQAGMAACYSSKLVGHRTTSGKPYDPNALTASHATIPLGTHVKVTNLKNGKSVVVVINDRMKSGKIIMDVSQRACKELEFGSGGKAKVKLEVEH